MNPKLTASTILLAEDDIDDIELLQEAIETIDPALELVSFQNGARFIQYIEHHAAHHLPNLIILDYNIPEMNGAEILVKLRDHTHYCQIPVVVWSTSDSPQYRSTCITLGAKAYLVKPSTMSGLVQTAREMLLHCR